MKRIIPKGSAKGNQADERYMKLALELAAKARGRTSPNPMVGAVVVNTGEVAGAGYHKKAGSPHAEVDAIAQAGNLAAGATIYVTLEPCCHFGRTPPCTKLIINSGVARVIAGCEDPNPIVNGKGIEELRAAGIKADVGVLEKECLKLNEAYFKFITTGMPFVLLKVAISLDGKIGTPRGESRWITGGAARQYVHKLRDSYDAVIVGINTVLRDDPLLTARVDGVDCRDPVRVILDSSLKIPLSAKLFSCESKAKTIVATTAAAPKEKARKLEEIGAEVMQLDGADGRVDLRRLLKELGSRGIASAIIEGGSEINCSALKAGVVDKIMFFIAPKLIGGADSPGPIGGNGPEKLSQAIELNEMKVELIDGDLLVEAYLEKKS